MKITKSVSLILTFLALTACQGNGSAKHNLYKSALRIDHDVDFPLTSKVDYEYNADGLVTSETTYELNEETSEYVLAGKKIHEYNKDGNHTLLSTQKVVNGELIESLKSVYTYSGKNIIKEEHYTLNSDNELYLNFYSDEYKYDNLNRLTSYVEFRYDKESGSCVKYEECTNTYQDSFETPIKMEVKNLTGNDELDITITRELDENGWVLLTKSVMKDYNESTFYTYDINGHTMSEATYTVDSETGLYKIVSMYDYSYTSNFDESGVSVTVFDNNGNVKTFTSYIYTYNDKNDIVKFEQYEYDFENAKYVLLCEETYTY